MRPILISGSFLFCAALVLGQGCSKFQMTGKEIQQMAVSLETCKKPVGVSGSPKSIEEAMALVNALPRPVSLNCFLEALDRPLKINLTNNTLSAQPAFSARSPRVFILNNPLIMSIVPEGPDKDKIEFSYLLSSAESIKGEIEFPIVDAVVASSVPYERIRYQAGTACSTCHTGERSATSITFATAFISKAYQPKANTKVSLSLFTAEYTNCNFNVEPERCARLHSLLGVGEVKSQEFPTDMAYFF